MTAAELSKSPRSIWRRRLIVLLAVALLVCLPAAWLVGRDMISLLLASTPEQRQDMEAVIITGLVDEIDRARSVDEAGLRPMASRSINQSCYSVPSSAIKQDAQFQPSPISKDGRFSDNQLIYQMTSVAVAAFMQSHSDAYRIDAADKFDPFTASLLRACIAATPFSGACSRHAGRTIGRNQEQVNRRMVEWGLRIPIKSSPGDPIRRYCDTLPIRLDPESQ